MPDLSIAECPGCIGRGTSTQCRVCDLPIPGWLQRRPSDGVGETNPALDGWAFALTLEALQEASWPS